MRAEEQLPAEVDEELNHTVGPVDYHRDPDWQANVLAAYRANLRRMSDIASRSGAKIVFVMPASNEKDCSPFKSELSLNSDSQIQAFDRLITDGEGAMATNDFATASAAYASATKLDNRHADAHYRYGQALLAERKADEALAEFRRAIDEDICPLRAISEIESAIRQVCSDRDLPLVDFQARLRRWSEAQSGLEILATSNFLIMCIRRLK